MSDKRMLHCWKGNDEDVEFGSEAWAQAFLEPATCMLEEGHAGPHEFTPDKAIGIAFAPSDEGYGQ